jgi:FecR-like protein
MWKGCLLVAAFAVAGAAEARAAPTVGTAAIIENQVTGTPASARAPIPLKRGDGLYVNELVQTANDGKAQLLFLDQTALSLAPDSAIVLDKFVYDPDRNVGTVVLNTIGGAFRFIGGTASSEKNGSSYLVNTPVAQIGIRGTYFEWAYKDGHLWTMLHEGAVEICLPTKECATLTEPGTYLVTRGSHLSDVKRWNGPAGDALSGHGKADQLYLGYLGSFGLIPTSTAPATQQPPGSPPPAGGPPPGGGGGPVTGGEGSGASGPPSVGGGPPPPPPCDCDVGFPPVLTGAGTIPPGLERHMDAGRLPPGLANNRNSVTFQPPGHTKK